MKNFITYLSLGISLGLVGNLRLSAQDTPPVAPTNATPPAPATIDPDLPQPVNFGEAQSLLAASPFTRSLNLSDSLILTGIAFIDGKAVATVLNKEKKESYVVSETPNAQGWRLAETSAAVQLNQTQAKIMIGSEIVTVRYSNEQLTPSKKNETRPASNENGRGRDRDRDRGRDRRGPDNETRQRIDALSPEARQKLFEEFRNNGERLRNASSDERRAFFQKMLERAENQNRR